MLKSHEAKETTMAHLDDSWLLELLTTTLPDFIIEKWARQLDVVERERKVDIVLLVWSLILGFPAGARRTLTSLQRRFEQMLGETLSDSSFYDRLTPAFADLMERLVEWCLDQQIEPLHSHLTESFEGFQDLLAVDSTVFNLYDLLADQWEGPNDGQAAAKLHVVADVIDSAARSVQLTDATTHDQTPWKTIGSWVVA
jgi:putative transposase